MFSLVPICQTLHQAFVYPFWTANASDSYLSTVVVGGGFCETGITCNYVQEARKGKATGWAGDCFVGSEGIASL